MAENKTKTTGASVKEFLAGIENETRRKDAVAIAKSIQYVRKVSV